ncbi:MAG: metalloregulator ArsR/SmtB family transcription factor [Chloroflexi bacterium]|nr:metalloregulator ArsR/SmtB family transcription factor [Chloroflexota bacterium]
MNTGQHEDLLALLKALADKQRLTMVGLLGEGERTVTDLAATLQLAEPTVSYHLSKLRESGLLQLRMDGNHRYYRLSKARIDQFRAYVAEIDAMPTAPEVRESDNAWIDALDWDEEAKKVLVAYTFNGKLTGFPTKEKKWLVLLRWLATKFEADVRYNEREVNEILTAFHEDYATIRRGLVEYGFMRRERGGGDYWLTEEDESVQVSP